MQQERQNRNTNKDIDITNHLNIDSPNSYFYCTLIELFKLFASLRCDISKSDKPVTLLLYWSLAAPRQKSITALSWFSGLHSVAKALPLVT